jgi:hypothetical protein
LNKPAISRKTRHVLLDRAHVMPLAVLDIALRAGTVALLLVLAAL